MYHMEENVFVPIAWLRIMKERCNVNNNNSRARLVIQLAEIVQYCKEHCANAIELSYSELSKQWHVSISTVKKDFSKLEKLGFVKNIPSSAITNYEDASSDIFFVRPKKNEIKNVLGVYNYGGQE